MIRRLSLIYALNIADWLCTLALLLTGDFYEVNPLMRPMIGDPSLGFAVKCVLPAFLLLLIYKLYAGLGMKELRRVDTVIAFVLALYTALCLLHIVNFLIAAGARSMTLDSG